jgi:hypothetical protein
MLFKAVKESFRNKPGETDFKLEHMWCALRHHSKWYTWHVDDDSNDGSKTSHLNLDGNYRSTSSDIVGSTRSIGCDRERAQHKGKETVASP